MPPQTAPQTRQPPAGQRGMKQTQKELEVKEPPAFLLWHEKVALVFGSIMMVCLLPLVGSVVGSAVLWDAIDRGFMGRPLDGILMKFASWVNEATHEWNKQFVKHSSDSYMVNTVILLGIGVPCLFFGCFYHTMVHGFSPVLCFIYHVLRIGPYFMNFAYVYTLCHKEGHAKLGLWKGRFSKNLTNVFNWWIGLYYGVLPSSFAYGHSINHHKYNNGPSDVVTTSDKPRDSFINFLCYLPRWLGYASNVTTVIQFAKERNSRVAVKMVTGTLYYFAFVAVFYWIDPTFAVWYLMFPLGENVLLLACINWCWHAFLSATDPEDEFVGSITIFDGPINVLNEDYHVVHHQYPGAHWTDHPKLYAKHADNGEYSDHVATMFKNTHAFELFFLIILRKYDIMAEKFHDPEKRLSFDQKKALIKKRLRTCWWGPRRNLNIKLQGKEIGNLDDGRPNVDGKKLK